MIYRTLSKVDPDNKGPCDKPTGWDWTRGIREREREREREKRRRRKDLSTHDRWEFVVTRTARIEAVNSIQFWSSTRNGLSYEFVITDGNKGPFVPSTSLAERMHRRSILLIVSDSLKSFFVCKYCPFRSTIFQITSRFRIRNSSYLFSTKKQFQEQFDIRYSIFEISWNFRLKKCKKFSFRSTTCWETPLWGHWEPRR